MQYVPPWRDMRFVIEELLELPARWAAMPAFEQVDAELARQVLEQAGRFASEVLAPINGPADLEGCRYADGVVQTPGGFREAYRTFVEAGWPALACEPDVGGQGLPQLLNATLYEMCTSANHAWTMYPGLLHGAYECLLRHASPELRERYLPKVVSGEWLSTMCLTEAQAGSDLGLVATRATPRADGAYALNGQKIFISGGEHDLTDNIVHLVLARLPGAPAGTKGLSLFLVPKWLPDGARNAAVCDGIEKKMGIKGSATCVMRFEGATGWLVGEPQRGLAAMFAMMNSARLHVGLQGLGHAEAASQHALRYAMERRQSRAPGAARGAEAADLLVRHPAVRRSLGWQRARVEAARMLAYEAAHWIDLAEHSPDADEQARAHRFAALLTPVVKAHLTDTGFDVVNDALQVFGGHGYVHEWGVEQSLRDCRIASIYEGTNQIQAIDLLVRKGVADGGRGLGELFDALEAEVPADAVHGAAVIFAIGQLRGATRAIVEASQGDAEAPYRVADDYLSAFGLLLGAHGFARADAVAARRLAAGGEAMDRAFYLAKRDSARVYLQRAMPLFQSRLALLSAIDAPLPVLEEA